MKKTLSTSEAADLLLADDNAGWSYAGARALVEHLEAVEDDTGEEMEFDRVALRCEFAEYESALKAADEYGWEPDTDSEDTEEAALKWLNDRTTVITFGGGVIVQQF
jgi:nucleoside-diphosphate-sugar epimerase